jgi:hypothetical protein
MEAANLTLRINTEGMSEAQRGMEGLTNTAEMLEGAFRKVAAAWASWEIFRQIRDVTTLAARYDTLGVVMQTIGNNAGYTGQQMAQFQASLEKTGISMLAARQSLTMMASAQLDLTKASQLGRVAQDAAVIGNVNSSEAFETLTRSITTGMAIEAHRLGIMVNYRKAEQDYAAALGKTASELTEQEKEHARLNEVLEQGAKRQGAYESAMETAGKQALSMERYVENLKVKLGETFQGAYAVIIRDMTSALQGAAAWVDKNTDKIKELGDSMVTVAKQGAEFTKLLGDIGGGASGASNSVGFLTRIFQGLGFLMAGATDILRAFAGQFVGFVGFLVQKLGAVVDTMTRLTGWGGKGGISKAGDSMAGWAQSIMAPLQSGNSALTSWYDDVLGDKASNGSSKASDALEKQRIAAANAARALREASDAGQSLYETNRSLYWLESSKGGDGWAAGNAQALGSGRTVSDNLLSPAKIEESHSRIEKLEATITTLMRKLRDAAESGDTFAIMGYEVANSSGYAADALTRWSTNVDGLGVSWTTLGATVRNVIADMLRQMERAIIQQKLMDPLLKWAGLAISGWAGGTSGLSTSGVAPSGSTGMTFAAPPSGGSAPQANIIVNVNGADTKATAKDGGAQAINLAQQVRGVVNQWAVEQSRSGGILARA